jgi:photosystem II stability/assembly factor-like uncharacterized protein
MKANKIFLFLIVFIILVFQLTDAQWTEKYTSSVNSVNTFLISDANLFIGTDHGVFLSTNNGARWTQVNSGLGADTSVTALAVSDTNLFAGTLGGVYRSTDNGTNWIQVNTGLTSTFVNTLVASGSNLLVGTSPVWNDSTLVGGGIFLSTNNGTNWTAINTGLTNTGSIYSLAVSGKNIFAGTSQSGVFLSTNNGKSWTPVNTGLTKTYIKALAIIGTNIFAGVSQGGVFLSTNNGSNWIAVNTGFPANTSARVFAVCGTNLFAGSSLNGLFLSTNNGSNWTAVNSGLPYYDDNISVVALAISGKDLFVAGILDYPNTLISRLNGVWQRPLSQMIPSVVLNQPVVAFGSVPTPFSKFDTLKITNSSTSNSLIIDSIYTGTKWFVVKSLCDTVGVADTLIIPILFTPDNLKAYSDTLYIISNASISPTKVLLSGNGTMTDVSQNNSNIPKSYGISQNYPNPFNPSTTIQYGLPSRSSVRLVIYNVLGQVVKELINTEQQAGVQSVVWNANASSGLYFYRINATSKEDPSKRFVETKKMLLLK